jgi:hypothetical protein
MNGSQHGMNYLHMIYTTVSATVLQEFNGSSQWSKAFMIKNNNQVVRFVKSI